jgi:hypothetical protein
MAINPNTDFTAGQVLTAAQQNRFPRGVMGYAVSTANHALTTSTSDVTGMSLTFTGVANRLYVASFTSLISIGNSLAIAYAILADGSNNPIVEYSVTSPTAGGVMTLTFEYPFTVTAGSVTRKIRAGVTAGTGTLVGVPANQRAYSFIIRDLGPS